MSASLQRTLSSQYRYTAASRDVGALWSWLRNHSWLLLAAVLAFAAGMRYLFLSQPGLHPDEALYAGWALQIAGGSDPTLLGVYVDKPPFLLYLLAGLFRLAGYGPESRLDAKLLVLVARTAALAISLASIGLLYGISRRSYGQGVAILAAVLFALSPLAVRLSGTLLTDPWLVLFFLVGLWAATEGHGWIAGIACGLAYATKQHAVMLIPLVLLACLWLAPQLTRRSAWRITNGFLLIFAVVTWWDSLRWQWMPSFWDRSLTTYGGVELASAPGLANSLGKWLELLGNVFGSPILGFAIIPAFMLVGWSIFRSRNRSGVERDCQPGWRGRLSLAVRTDLWVAGFLAAYLAAHLVTSLAPWDRYLLPVVPILSLLLARGVFLLLAALQKSGPGQRSFSSMAALGHRSVFVLLLLLLSIGLLQSGWISMAADLPVGDNTAYDGVDEIAGFLRQDSTSNAVLYHHWLGWHYSFYLHDSDIEQRWWQSTEDLAQKTQGSLLRSQFIAFPAGRDTIPAREALESAGFTLSPQLVVRHGDGTSSITLFRIDPQLAEVIPDDH
ncbi:MAG: glycosyltransferase family 39 protein [Chloroflexota bacterium]|nr:glycosyltransferase family 39 protein [Chloroflexota bacterium]